MREIKFRAWDKKNKVMFKIFDNVSREDWYLPQWKESHEVMQFTGLHDKNGKEIYEGDIVLFSTSWNQTEYHKNKFGIKRVVEFAKGSFSYCMVYGDMDVVEVIGNIYENPELLKEC